MRVPTSSSALLSTLLLTIPTFAKSPTVKTIYQFPNPTWVENLNSLSNGSLLVSLIGRPELHLVHPLSSPATSNLVHSFPNVDSVFGTAELSPGFFAVITGNYSLATGPTLGSSNVWTVDFSACASLPGRKKAPAPVIRKITDIPSAQLLNGAAPLNAHTVLLADSFAGNVIALNVRTGNYSVVLDDASMKPTGEGTPAIGVNGMKMRNGHLYYTNSLHGSLSRVKVNKETGKATGKFEQLAHGITFPDDFAITEDGTAFVAEPFGNVVARVSNKGAVSQFAGNLNSSEIAGPTSLTLGRGRAKGAVFAGTEGGLAGPVNGTYTEGGKVVGIWL